MYKIQLMSLARFASVMSMTIRNSSTLCAIVNKSCVFNNASSQFVKNYDFKQRIHTTPTINGYKVVISDSVPNYTYLSGVRQFFRYHCFLKYIYRGRGSLLYTYACDHLDYIGIMKNFKMADTYFSWFLITELHVWMLMVRLEAGNKAGVDMRKNVVTAMWKDAEMRKKKLGNFRGNDISKQMEELGHQFNAAIVGYDEGLLSDDQTLAGAIWRTFLEMKCDDPKLMEKMIIYIRKNIQMLDNIPVLSLINSAKVTWIDHRTC
ncbi:hypothetical protein PV327_000631 [Microctonus hyperodae]|uniref:Ubiquinol-cytochrome c chaperone domain-containing protein n=1 Tax=Microctonus hyperodae TaxID=165561 RepID=A0AA39G7J2_MICHY|nr:hypothetical protein PV327_000631 [Microctonus hyperodae]